MRVVYAKPVDEETGTVWDVGRRRSAILDTKRRHSVDFAIKSSRVTDVWLNCIDFPIDSRCLSFEYKSGEKVEAAELWQ